MGDLNEFSLSRRVFLTAYPWRRVRPVPQSPLRRPLSESKVALVTSAGFIMRGHELFNERIRGGDPSYRVILRDTEVTQLIDSHRSGSFDHARMRQEPNLVFPPDRLRELAFRRRIGSVRPRHLSFTGSITVPGRLINESAVRAATILVEDHVDAALVPV